MWLSKYWHALSRVIDVLQEERAKEGVGRHFLDRASEDADRGQRAWAMGSDSLK